MQQTTHTTNPSLPDVALEELTAFPEEFADEALVYAHHAMQAASHLTTAQSLADTRDGSKFLSIAVESYIERFNIPRAALEDNELTTTTHSSKVTDRSSEDTRSRAAKVIDYLYAAAKRIFQYFFDYLRNQKIVARKIIPMTKDLIGRIDAHGGTVSSARITDKGVIVGLHIDGVAPQRAGPLFEELCSRLKAINATTGITELALVLSAAKAGNEETLVSRSKKLHDTLEDGMKKFMSEVASPKNHPAFHSAHDGETCYATDRMFGQHYITGVISEPDNRGRFVFKAGITRDAEVPVRADSYPVLTPDEIRHICRASLRLSEEIIEYSRDEDLVQKLMREASFFVTKEGGPLSVPALHNFVSVANNHYFAYLRYASRIMQLLMRWASLSVAAYERANNA